jgi:HYDIN/CFA65/VesB family protein/ASPM-SPD-2-Hydin domain-containing protein
LKSTQIASDARGLLFLMIIVISLSATATTTYSIVLTPAPLAFGSVAVGSSATRTEMVANPGWKKVILTGASVTGTGFTLKYHPAFPYTLSAGTSVAFKVKFAPQAAGSVSGKMAVHYKYLKNGSWIWTSRSVQITGAGTITTASLVASPTSLSFGTVQVSSTKTVAETVTNSGSTAVTISQITTTGAGYSFSGIAPPATLSAGQSVSFKISFKPQTSGSTSGKLTISSNASNPTLSVPLSGAGAIAGQMALSPSSVNFGNVVVGTKKTQTGTVSAVNGPITISAANVTGLEFSVNGLSFPFTLSAGQSASYNLNFAPSASGTTSATVSWLSSASNTPQTQSLTGTGTPPSTHSVALTWNASTSTQIVGYNIYRARQAGGPYTQINTALDPSLHYLDYNVQAGYTYYYVVTAVNSAGAESAYSNQIKAAIPYP